MVENLSILESIIDEMEQNHQRRIWEYESLKKELEDLSRQHDQLTKEIEYIEAEKTILFKASEWARTQSIKECNEMLTHALQYIFDKDVSCEAVVEEKYGKPALEFIVRSKDGDLNVEGPPELTRGGGLSDVLGIVLQIILDGKGPFIIDEKARSLSKEYVPQLYEFLKMICTTMECQMLIATHQDHLIESGDRIFSFVKRGEFEVRS